MSAGAAVGRQLAARRPRPAGRGPAGRPSGSSPGRRSGWRRPARPGGARAGRRRRCRAARGPGGPRRTRSGTAPGRGGGSRRPGRRRRPTRSTRSGTRCWDCPWGRARKTTSSPSRAAASVGAVDQVRVGGGQRRGVGGHRLAGVRPGGGHRHLEVGVAGAQAQQLRAAVAGGTDDPDLLGRSRHAASLCDISHEYATCSRSRSTRGSGGVPPPGSVPAWTAPRPSPTPRPLSFWLDDPAAPEPAPPLVGPDRGRPGGGRRRLHRAVGGAAGQGGRPVGRRGGARGRPVRLGGVGAQRRVLRGQPHPRAGQRRRAVPRRDRHPRAPRAARTSTPSRPPSPPRGSTATSSAPASSTWPPSPTRSAGCARPRPRPAAHGASPVFLDRDELRAEVHSPAFLAGLWDPDSCALVNPARLAWGLRARLRAGRRAHPRALPGRRARARTVPDRAAPMVRPHRPRPGHRPPGGAGHQRLAVAGPAAAQVHRAGLRLRADDRAARPRPRRRPSGGSGARASAPPATSSSTSAGRPTTGSCSAATTPSTTTATRMGAALEQRPATFTLLSTLFAETVPDTRGRALHPLVVRGHRHLLAVLRLLRPLVRRPGGLGGRLHRPRRRGVPVRGPGGPRPGVRRRHGAHPTAASCGRSRSRSHPSRCARSGST